MTVKSILILTLSLFAFCLGDPECSPINQCRDLWTAKKCDAVKHCIDENWSKLKPTGNRDDVCSICLEMVEEARDTLMSNETRVRIVSKEQLIEVFEGSCRLLVLKPAVEVCDKLVDQFVPELVAMLSSQMDPEAVCSVARLCNNEAFRVALKNSKDCVHCEAFAQVSDEMMESVTFDDFEKGMLDVCRTAGSYSDACSQLALTHSKFLYNTAKSVLKRKPCETTLVCPSTTNSSDSVSQPQPLAKKNMCPLCKTVMTNVRKQLLKAKTHEKFAENMDRICTEFSIPVGVNRLLTSPEFYENLKSSQTLPDVFCYAAFCKDKPTEDSPIWPLVSSSDQQSESDLFQFLSFADVLLPQKEEEAQPTVRPTIAYGDVIRNPVFLGPMLSSKLYGGNSEECDTCNEVLEILSDPVRNDDDYLNKMFDVVCIGVKKPEPCKRFIQKYSQILTRAFAEDGVSKEMCADLVPYCQVKKSKTTQPESCGLCLSIMNVLKNGDNAQWAPTLQETCNRLPKSSPNICRDMSSTFLTLSDLLKNSTENEACSFVNLCEPSLVKEQAPSKPSCQTCMLTIQSLVDALQSNESDLIIESVLDSLCDLLPHVERRLCLNLVKTIGVEGFKKLVENLNPSDICADLHICKKRNEPSTAPVLPARVEIPKNEDNEEKVPCKFCLMAVKMMLDDLGDEKTEEAIRKVLNNLCQYFPEETRDTCRNLIDQYADALIDMIIADFNASEICTFLKICPTQHLFGADGHDKKFATFDVETNEVRDWVEPGMEKTLDKREKNETFTLDKRVEIAFREFHKIVQECALCEALVGVISTHKRMWVKNYDFSLNADRICAIVPDDKRQMCTSMLVSYGPSIANLLRDHGVDPNEVCVYLDLCDEEMQAKVNQPVSVPEPKVVPEGKNDCMLGPVFWCANAENAEKCGTFLHCQETVWKSWKSPPTRRNNTS